MESQEVLDTQGVSNNSSISCGDGLERLGSGVKGSDNLGVDLLEYFDSYCEDINDRLTVSRMVNGAVIRGIVRAVEQEAAENVEAKELEVASLKRSLHLDVGEKKFESYEPEIISYRQRLDLSNIYVEHDKMRESLGSLRYAVTEQFDKLKKETCGIRGCNSIRRINSGSELVGLGGILEEKETESCAGVDRTVDNLKMTVDTIITRVDDTLRLSKISLCEWQQEQEFQREIEAMVMQSSIRSLQEEFEQKLWDQNATFQSVNWLEKFNEISNLRKELDVILKLLPNHENGQLDSNGWGDVDHSHLKGLNLLVGVEVTEDFDADKFKHTSKVDMAKHFNSIIRDIKRDHESTVQRLTEEFISWKGKFLNKMRSSLLNRKDKEFDLLKKKIPEVILKLDDIIADNEKLPAFPENDVGGLNDRLDSLLSENRQLRDLLTDKKNEVKCLLSQVSDATEKTLQYSSAVEDVRVEVSILEEVYKCVIEGLSGHIKSNSEESEMKSSMIQEIYGIIFGEATLSKTIGSCEIEDSDMESLVMLEMCGFLFRESIKDATGQLKELHQEYLTEKESRVSLEMKVVEKEQKVALLGTLVEEKEKLAVQQSETLMKKSQQFDLSYKELNELRDQTKSQQQLISETCKDLDLVKGELKEALQQIELHKMEINSLNKHLELQIHKLEKADEQKKMLVAISQARKNHLSWLEAQEKDWNKQMEAVIGFGRALSEQFTLLECKVSENIKSNNLRLIDSKSQLSSLTEKAHMLTKAGLQYKQRLERRCSDLKMAEAEVDLLGDEVEALLSLLEKIYIALDHYSPILQHYPGVIEILKLVKRELSGEPSKSV